MVVKSKNVEACTRQVANFSTVKLSDRFDNPKFNPDELTKTLHLKSPKLVSLLEKIKSLDKKDFWLTGKLYKHFIFTDLKKGSAKMIASAMISAGYKPIFHKVGNTIVNSIPKDNDSNFALLSSTALYKVPFDTKYIKKTLDIYNERPANVYGDNVRFIILDSGFKEGIDLFDVKYVHLFENPETNADATQSIGRALRYCGQKGLPYKKWEVSVYIYKSVFKGVEFVKKNEKNAVIDAIDTVIKENSIDYLLNKGICE